MIYALIFNSLSQQHFAYSKCVQITSFQVRENRMNGLEVLNFFLMAEKLSWWKWVGPGSDSALLPEEAQDQIFYLSHMVPEI